MGIKGFVSIIKHGLLGVLCTPAFRRRRFLTDLETIAYVLENKCSLSRYGNGEINLLLGQSIPFQEYSEELKRALREPKTDDRCLVCIPGFVYKAAKKGILEDFQYHWWKKEASYTKYYYYKYLGKSMLFGDTQCTRFYIDYKDKSPKRVSLYINNFLKIWEGRDLIIIEGDHTLLGIGNNLFDRARTIRRILCPSKNAFRVIEDVREWVNANIEKECVIILALGPAATVLSYRLSRDGYQALDLGHIDVEYSWFLTGARNKTSISHKYVNEVTEGQNPEPCQDSVYLEQISMKFLGTQIQNTSAEDN